MSNSRRKASTPTRSRCCRSAASGCAANAFPAGLTSVNAPAGHDQQQHGRDQHLQEREARDRRRAHRDRGHSRRPSRLHARPPWRHPASARRHALPRAAVRMPRSVTSTCSTSVSGPASEAAIDQRRMIGAAGRRNGAPAEPASLRVHVVHVPVRVRGKRARRRWRQADGRSGRHRRALPRRRERPPDWTRHRSRGSPPSSIAQARAFSCSIFCSARMTARVVFRDATLARVAYASRSASDTSATDENAWSRPSPRSAKSRTDHPARACAVAVRKQMRRAPCESALQMALR